VQVGAYSKRENAEAQLKKIKAAGFTDAFIAVSK
jgi:cell division septation protein DedD